MKQIIKILGIFTFAGCIGCSSHEISRLKTIVIKSNGKMEALPDMATFNIRLTCIEKSVNLSKQNLVYESNTLNDQLLSFGIEKEDILTTSVDMNKSYTWKNNSRLFEGYTSSTNTYVTIRNMEKLDTIYTELLGTGNLSLSGLTYSHSKLDSLTNEAYKDGLEKSGVLADKLLSELPETKKEVLRIGNIELSQSIELDKKQFNAMENKSLEKRKTVAINRGKVIVGATLFVIYKIH